MVAIVWLILIIALVVVEFFTLQFVAISFAIGALLAFLAAIIGLNLAFQMIVFLVTAIVSTVVFVPMIKKLQVKRITHTNSDAIIGTIGIVLQDICNIQSTGRVIVNGLDWSARSLHGEAIPKDTQVLIHSIDGVKVIVTPLAQTQISNEPIHTITEVLEIE